MTDFTLDTTTETAINHFDAGRKPVHRIVPGQSLRVHTLDAHGHTERQSAPGEVKPTLLDGPGHCLLGPIAVTGARPGQVLAIRFDSLTPDDWGWTKAGAKDNHLSRNLGVVTGDGPEPFTLLWDNDAEAGRATNHLGLSVPLAPFFGVIGLPPESSGRFSTIPPRPNGGGNIDCRELVAGSTLYIPVTVEDALLYLGDGHGAQGDGEVSGTAIECGMTAEMTVDLVEDAPVESIHATTPAGRITFGFDADLNAATEVALGAMITWMQKLFDIGRREALAVASASVSLRITQIANETWGVHALLPEGVVHQSH